jgi:hypothetical protein
MNPPTNTPAPLTSEFPPVPDPVNSFVEGTAGLDFAVAVDIGNKLFSTVGNGLSAFDKFVQDIEEVFTVGRSVTFKNNVYHATPEAIQRVMGERAFNDLANIAIKGRSLLEQLGHKKKVNAKPSQMVMSQDGRSAVAMVQTRTQHPRLPGQVPMESTDLIPTSTAPPDAPSSKVMLPGGGIVDNPIAAALKDRKSK